MRTKHLFYTAAMAALFAACVNDDFETISKGQNTANDGRPVVSDVKLNFTTGADTRLAFGEDGYAWETNDTIGALLMDNVMVPDPENENYTWLEKYALTANIHTSYPFTYSTAEQTWGCNTKMLEGNYFFAYPWEDYDGERRVRHYLTKQSQEGVGPEVVRESYTKNQFFVGYSQIMAGTDAKDALTDVEMVPMLGAIQLRIVNTGTQTYHINKVVLRGTELASALTFNPTNAEYGTWNLVNDKLTTWNATGKSYFNYADYTGNEADIYGFGTTEKVFDIADEDLQKYDRTVALKKMVKPIDNEGYSQLIINGTKEQRALISTKTDEDAVAYVLIMASEIEEVADGDLTLDIYTDEGIVQGVDLTDAPGAEADTKIYGAIIDSEVKKISIDTKNTIGVQIDDNSFRTPITMQINNDADLKQFIEWNYNIDGARTPTATIVKEGVTLTAEMAEMLAKKSNLVLTIQNKVGESIALNLGEDLPANILDYKNLIIATPVNVQGTINISKDSNLPKTDKGSTEMTIEEGAVLNINDEIDEDNNDQYNVVNKGTVNVAAKDIAVEGEFVNNAAMTIGATADVKATVTNTKVEKEVEAIITNNGFMQEVKNNAEAEVNLGKGAIIASGENAAEGVIRTADEAQVSLSNNNGDVIYVSGATIVVAGGSGDIAYEAAGTINDALYAELKGAKVTKLIIDGAVSLTTKGLATETSGTPIFDEVVANAGSLLVDKETALYAGSLTVEESLTTGGIINVAGEVEVKKDAILTNNGTISSNEFENYGRVNNNGAVNVTEKLVNNGDWMYNKVNDGTGAADAAMNTAVNKWMDNWENFINGNMTNYYNGNPRDVAAFADAFAEWERLGESWISNFKTQWKVNGNTDAAYEAALKANSNAGVASMKKFVDQRLAQSATAAKAVLYAADGVTFAKQFSTERESCFDNQQAVYDDMSTAISAMWSIWFSNDAKAAAWSWAAQATVFADFVKVNKYIYVWKGSTVDQVVDMWETIGGQVSGSAFKPGTSDGQELVAWVSFFLNTNDQSATTNTVKNKLKELGVDILNCNDLFSGFTADQLKACADKD